MPDLLVIMFSHSKFGRRRGDGDPFLDDTGGVLLCFVSILSPTSTRSPSPCLPPEPAAAEVHASCRWTSTRSMTTTSLHADLPGVDPGSVDVQVDGSTLTLTAHRSAISEEGVDVAGR